MIEFRNVYKQFGNTSVLHDLSFRIETGELVVMIGPSGCGKTTTLKLINRLLEPDSGSIMIDEKPIAEIDKVQLRRSIGYVIQQIGLFPNMTIEQNIGVVPKLMRYSKEKVHQIVLEMLDLVDMPYDQFAHKFPSQLSGGQQQRIGVLRALAASPPIVLMDEPFGALDPMARTLLQQEVHQLQKKLNKTMLFVTHDMNEALSIADRIIFLDEGHIIQQAPPAVFLSNPANELVRSFMEKRGRGLQHAPQTASDVMETRYTSASASASASMAVSMMVKDLCDHLVVINENKEFAGLLTLQAAAAASQDTPVGSIILSDAPIAHLNDSANACFTMLETSEAHCVVVLQKDNTVAGIITERAMASALADVVWG